MEVEAKAVWNSLPAPDREWLNELTALAPAGARVALVGGAVRDGLLGIPSSTSPDLDLAIEGADIQALALATGLPFTFHPAFGNATVTLPDDRTVDLIRTRRETYPVVGGNPVPEPGTLSDDLQRRDFGLNALALVLEPNGTVSLLDEVGGLSDVRGRVLRPLHSGSFHEDASRLIRAARLAARLDLAAHPNLLTQVPDALKMAEQTPRLWAELRLLLAEPRPGRAARKLETWGAGQLLPPPSLPLLDALDTLQDGGVNLSQPFQTYAAALLHPAPNPDDLAARLNLGEKPAALLARALSDTPFPEGSPERILRHLLRPDAYTPLTGRDVVALGVPAGKEIGAALTYLAGLRAAGQVQSAEGERAALRQYLDSRNVNSRPPS
ncbi:CCA tRNA nucleotidyltransferase [Deinococcus sp. QL22]|uniref:CCA tRNA nucleotidyltransferase n=1 Tax=Deinococcus sp. QL22 TaxID=2939437 RepID=UPI0020170CBC|nr:CCA tRNA nucleotidyltransferase [Deinococcus sp. QL22]UQN06436.1 CCA tRNA nucleotidyltransferase [Deinococcus sp. QL22]